MLSIINALDINQFFDFHISLLATLHICPHVVVTVYAGRGLFAIEVPIEQHYLGLVYKVG